MDPATLVKQARERHGLSQARLAHRARTTQAAISRIERGEEGVTWERLRGLLHAVGEEPEVSSTPIDYDGDSFDVLSVRDAPMELRLPRMLSANESFSRLRGAIAEGQRRKGQAVTVRKPEPVEHHRIINVLLEFGVEFVLIGGIAVQAYGTTRLTWDVDLVAKPGLLNFSRLAEALVDLEAEWRDARITLPLDNPQRIARAQQLALRTKFGDLDVMRAENVHGQSYEELRSRALTVPFGDGNVLVVGVDDLIRMKRLAGRWQDLIDIATLTRPSDDLRREADEFYDRVREQLEGDG